MTKTETGWMIEMPGPMYWHRGTAGFTIDALKGVRFARKEDAIQVITDVIHEGLVGSCRAIEHSFETEVASYDAKQDACQLDGTRYYGDGGTIHSSGHVDVETRGEEVVAVWFRCQPLPFRQTDVDSGRAIDMKRMYQAQKFSLRGVEIKDV